MPESDAESKGIDISFKCRLIFYKIMDGRKTDQVALVLAGTPQTDNSLWSQESSEEYAHITVARAFDMARYEMIRFLQEGLPLGAAGQAPADPVDAIVVAADLLITLTKGKAYGSRRIVLFSAFDGEAPGEQGLDQILDTLKGNGITLDIISVAEEGETETSSFLESKLVEPLDGAVYDIDEALGMLAEFAAKRSKQVATFKGTLDLAISENEEETANKGMKIPVSIYARTASSKLPTAHKTTGQGKGEVERALSYRRAEGEDPGERTVTLARETLIKAYRYGRTLVPFSKIDEAAMGYAAQKTLSLLGFVSAASIDRAAFLSPAWMVVPEAGNAAARTALAAIVQACFEREAAGLARYVRAANSSPRLVALLPVLEPDAPASFLMVALPFAEDLRRFTFPSLQALPKVLQPTALQLDAMRKWIQAMRLPDENEEQLPANPSNQRLVQAVLARIQNPTGPVPLPEPRILEPLAGPPPILRLQAHDAFTAIRDSFELRRAPTWRHAEIIRFWGQTETTHMAVEEAAAPVETPATEKDVDEAPAAEPKRHISAEHPLEDFEAMVSDRHHDLVLTAFHQLMALIPRLALEPNSLPVAVEALMALRRAAIREDEFDLYNAYLRELKRAAVAVTEVESGDGNEEMVSPAAILWTHLQSKHPQPSSVTLISSADNPGSLVPPDHAESFFTGPLK